MFLIADRARAAEDRQGVRRLAQSRNSCLRITRRAGRDELIATPTILPVHARAGRGRAEAGHTSQGAARYFALFRLSILIGCLMPL